MLRSHYLIAFKHVVGVVLFPLWLHWVVAIWTKRKKKKKLQSEIYRRRLCLGHSKRAKASAAETQNLLVDVKIATNSNNKRRWKITTGVYFDTAKCLFCPTSRKLRKTLSFLSLSLSACSFSAFLYVYRIRKHNFKSSIYFRLFWDYV